MNRRMIEVRHKILLQGITPDGRDRAIKILERRNEPQRIKAQTKRKSNNWIGNSMPYCRVCDTPNHLSIAEVVK